MVEHILSPTNAMSLMGLENLRPVAYYANALPTELKEISTTAISGGWL
jgi:hypothetical protein